jgi:hypothetical protein
MFVIRRFYCLTANMLPTMRLAVQRLNLVYGNLRARQCKGNLPLILDQTSINFKQQIQDAVNIIVSKTLLLTTTLFNRRSSFLKNMFKK